MVSNLFLSAHRLATVSEVEEVSLNCERRVSAAGDSLPLLYCSPTWAQPKGQSIWRGTSTLLTSLKNQTKNSIRCTTLALLQHGLVYTDAKGVAGKSYTLLGSRSLPKITISTLTDKERSGGS